MKKFLVEHKDWDKPPIRVVLYQPPYEDENVLNKTGWKVKDVTITELDIEEIEWIEHNQYLRYL
mgnify:CR=1 FL=1